MFGFSKISNQPQEQVDGLIGYYRLRDWWFKTFSKEERKYINEKYQPLGGRKHELTEGALTYVGGSPLMLFSTLAGWFDNQRDRPIAYKITALAETFITPNSEVLDLHFFYANKMKLFYKERDNPAALETAMQAAKNQIALADKAAQAFVSKYGKGLPYHEGYSQLIIMLMRLGNYQEAIDCAEQAKKQGWNGDWDGYIIQRCRKKLKIAETK